MRPEAPGRQPAVSDAEPPPWQVNRLLADLDAARVRERVPELEYMSDKNLAIILFQARFRSRSRSLLFVLGALAGFLVLVVVSFAMLLYQTRYRAPLACFVLALVAIVFVAVPLAAVAAERSCTRRALRRRLMSLTCFKCTYDLRKTPRESDTLTCPECGAVNLLPQHPVDP